MCYKYFIVDLWLHVTFSPGWSLKWLCNVLKLVQFGDKNHWCDEGIGHGGLLRVSFTHLIMVSGHVSGIFSQFWILLCNLMLKHHGISLSSVTSGRIVPRVKIFESNPFIARERYNVKHYCSSLRPYHSHINGGSARATLAPLAIRAQIIVHSWRLQLLFDGCCTLIVRVLHHLFFWHASTPLPR